MHTYILRLTRGYKRATCILKCVDINAFVEQGAAHVYCECEEEEEGTGVWIAIIGLSDGRFKQESTMMKNSTTQKYSPWQESNC